MTTIHNFNSISEVELIYTNTQPKNLRTQIVSSKSAAQTLRETIGNKIELKEFFYVILLNNSADVLTISKLSEGGITGTYVDLRLLFATALKAAATAIIIAHNHPSGKLEASQTDKTLTNKVKKAGEILDIRLLDHIIITPENHFSFADEGIL